MLPWFPSLAFAGPPTYTVESLGSLPGLPDSAGVRANNAGHVLGGAWSQNASEHGCLWRDANGDGMLDVSEIIPIGTIGGGMSTVRGINESAIVVGWASQADNTYRAIRWTEGGGIEILPSLPGIWAQAFGINKAGFMVGRSRTQPIGTPNSREHAVLWTPDGQISDITPAPGNEHTGALDINDEGWILGRTAPSSGWVIIEGAAFGLGGSNNVVPNSLSSTGTVAGYRLVGGVWRATKWIWNPPQNQFVDFSLAGVSGATNTFARGINSADDIVGHATIGGSNRAMLWPDGELPIDLNDLLPPDSGWVLREAFDINDAGVIVGFGDLNGDSFRAFLLRPETPDLDTDGDGLLDEWEREGGGIDVDGDGTVDFDLHALGANPFRKDLFVEVDAMTGFAPPAAIFAKVTQSFAQAPVANPDGSTGITLHVIFDEVDLPHFPTLVLPAVGLPQDYFNLKGIHFGTPLERAGADPEATLAAKALAFRYCLFADKSHDGTLGVAYDIHADDFIVFRGAFVQGPGGLCEDCDIDLWLASTFMHELGHALGLRHGGHENTNLKPNYISTMNYLRQLPFRLGEDLWRLDFSRGTMLPLDESNLDESLGFVDAGGHSLLTQTYYTQHACDAEGGSSDSCVVPIAKAANITVSGALVDFKGLEVDFNGDGTIAAGVCADLNYYGANSSLVGSGSTPSPCQLLTDHDDWSALLYKTVAASALKSPSLKDKQPERIDELTVEMVAELLARLPAPPAAPCVGDLSGNGNVGAEDLAMLLAAWNTPNGDLDGDRLTSAPDLVILLGAWGACGGR